MNKGIVYFKDGHTEEMTSISMFRDARYLVDVLYFSTESGNYTCSQSIEYDEKLPRGGVPLSIKFRVSKFFKKEINTNDEPCLVEIDNIEHITIRSNDVVATFI